MASGASEKKPKKRAEQGDTGEFVWRIVSAGRCQPLHSVEQVSRHGIPCKSPDRPPTVAKEGHEEERKSFSGVVPPRLKCGASLSTWSLLSRLYPLVNARSSGATSSPGAFSFRTDADARPSPIRELRLSSHRQISSRARDARFLIPSFPVEHC